MAGLLRHDSSTLDFGRPLTTRRRRAHTYVLIGAMALFVLFALALALRGMYAAPVEFEYPVPMPLAVVA